MNIQLNLLQIAGTIIAWFLIGSVLDYLKAALATVGYFIYFIPEKIKNVSRSAKASLVKGDVFSGLMRLVLTVIEVFFSLLEQVIRWCFLVLIYLVVFVFFIPNLITKLIVEKIFGGQYYEFYGENLENANLEKESNSTKEKPSIEIKINGNSMSGNIIIGSSGGHKQIDDKTDEVYVELKKLLNAIGKKFFKISIGHPQFISKGSESPFVVQLYFEELTDNVKTKIKKIIGEKYSERVYDTELKLGQVVKIKLFSPDIIFPEPIAKKLDSSVNAMTFLGKPLDTCQPGEHKVVLSILDNKTGIEFQSETFAVKVSDFAFDHVSRPLLSRVSTVILGVGSFAMFILTLLEQIDKTIGLTSGTAAGILAAVVYTNFYNLYQRIRPNTP